MTAADRLTEAERRFNARHAEHFADPANVPGTREYAAKNDEPHGWAVMLPLDEQPEAPEPPAVSTKCRSLRRAVIGAAMIEAIGNRALHESAPGRYGLRFHAQTPAFVTCCVLCSAPFERERFGDESAVCDACLAKAQGPQAEPEPVEPSPSILTGIGRDDEPRELNHAERRFITGEGQDA